MQVFRADEFTGKRAWDAIDIARISDATVRLHWTDAAYIWHVNDGPEVFIVVDGQVDMHMRGPGGDTCVRLRAGDIFHARDGDAHKAVPVGAARILVVEQAGSI